MAYSPQELQQWLWEAGTYPAPATSFDYHRAQIERWLWDARERMYPPVLDIGAEWDRDYAGQTNQPWLQAREPTPRGSKPLPYLPRYTTLNNGIHENMSLGTIRPGILGSVTALPVRDGVLGTVLCTEVLEHVFNLFRAVAEIKRVLRPGGRAFISTPFYWPTHDNLYYQDYWRLTEQAYRALFHDAASVTVTEAVMQHPATTFMGEMAVVENMGRGWECRAPLGYMVEVVK